MAKLNYYRIKNDTGSATALSQYLGVAIPNGVENENEIRSAIVTSEHIGGATFDMIMRAAFEVAATYVAQGRDVNFGAFKLVGKCRGSLPCEDSLFNEGLVLVIDTDATNAARDAITTLEPTTITESVARRSVAFSNVMDAATEVFGLIDGRKQFVVLGNGLTFDDATNESIKLYDMKDEELTTPLLTATISSVTRGQRAYCTFAGAVEKTGKYRLVVTTKGLIGATTPFVLSKPVEVIKAPPLEPTLTDLRTNPEVPHAIEAGVTGFHVYGTNFDKLDKTVADFMKVVYYLADDEYEKVITADKITMTSNTEMTVNDGIPSEATLGKTSMVFVKWGTTLLHAEAETVSP